MPPAPLRILQLIDPASGFQATRAATTLASTLGPNFEIETRPLTPRLITTFHQLRTALRNFDLIHALGTHALTSAALATPGRIVFTPDDEPTHRQIRWLRAAMTYRNIHVLATSGRQHRLFIERAIPVDRCHLIRPGVEFARIRKRRDTDLRRALGFTDDDRVMLLIGESTRSSGHADAFWGAAILHVLNPKYKVLAWRRGPRTDALNHFALSQKHTTLLTIAEQRIGKKIDFEDLFPAADLLLVTPTAPVAILPIAIAMASGLPIVATASRTAGELLEDRHTALLAASGSPRALARRVLDLEEDPSAQWALSDQARTEAYEYFSVTRFVEQHRIVYRQITAGEPVRVPDSIDIHAGAR